MVELKLSSCLRFFNILIGSCAMFVILIFVWVYVLQTKTRNRDRETRTFHLHKAKDEGQVGSRGPLEKIKEKRRIFSGRGSRD